LGHQFHCWLLFGDSEQLMSVPMVNGNISDVSVAVWPVGSDSCPDNGATVGGSLKDELRFSHSGFLKGKKF
jgi:hypothetical protein